MAPRPRQPVPPDEHELPPGLAGALGRLHDRTVSVPAAVDEAILRDARDGFGRRRRFRLAARWIGAGAAAAAAVVVVGVNLHRGPAPADVAASALAGDVDGNGRVDIVDALLLARKVEAHASPGAGREDVNGDGVLDQRDVDAVAAAAVRLPGGVQ